MTKLSRGVWVTPAVVAGVVCISMGLQTARAVSPAPSAAPTVEDVMKKLNSGRPSLTQRIGQELNSQAPPWEMIQQQTAEYRTMATALEQNEPPKGSKESWKKLASAYGTLATTLDEAAKRKDQNAAKQAHRQLMGSCMPCHREHRPMKR
jgi:cytochrome c'